MAGLRRTRDSTTSAVTPLISIGHGWLKSAIDARNGTKLTEVLTLAKGMRKNSDSLMTARRANATKPFQNLDGNDGMGGQGSENNRTPAARQTIATRA